MRNWNARSLILQNTSSSSLLVYLWGIETTMSASQFPGSWQLLVYLWGIETDCFGEIYPVANWVISLPMRNWNQNLYRHSPVHGQLLVYLWGIETRPYRQSFWDKRLLLVYLWGIETAALPCKYLFVGELLVYLWGIETPTRPCQIGRFGNVISLPMRNWN